jgi:hypothetical protein
MSVLTATHAMNVDFIMSTWRPGSYPEPWSWADEIADLKSRGELHSMSADFLREAAWDESIILGGDGRVWDGHHRIIAAYMTGVRSLPCTFMFVSGA